MTIASRTSFALFLLFGICAPLSFAGDPFAETDTSAEPQLLRGVTYVVRDDVDLKADVYVPSQEGPCPGVLMVHGGAWTAGQRWHMHRDAQAVARHGYTVVSISYRLAPKYKFPAQIQDCKAAVRWMRSSTSKYKIDPRRIAGYGYSAGGHLVCLLGLTDDSHKFDEPPPGDEKPSTKLQAVIAGGAPCDFSWIGPRARILTYWLDKTRAEDPEVYRVASPTTYVSADDPPVFFYHGERDELVPKVSPTLLSQRLRKSGVRSEFFVVKDSGHLGAFLNQQALPSALKFLDETLKPPAAKP